MALERKHILTIAHLGEIFKRMYAPTVPQPPTSLSNAPPSTVTPSLSNNEEDAELLALIKQNLVLEAVEPEKLEAMADRFAEQIPEETFSPAEVQGFLLTRKKEPGRALREVGEWRDGVIEGRKKGKKVEEEKEVREEGVKEVKEERI
jgi:chaperone BCS1